MTVATKNLMSVGDEVGDAFACRLHLRPQLQILRSIVQ